MTHTIIKRFYECPNLADFKQKLSIYEEICRLEPFKPKTMHIPTDTPKFSVDEKSRKITSETQATDDTALFHQLVGS